MKEKIRASMLKLKNRKAPGLDDITNEMIKYGGENLLKELEIFFNKIILYSKVPDQWKESINITHL